MAKQSSAFSAIKGKGRIVITHKESKERLVIDFSTHFEEGIVNITDKKTGEPLRDIHFRIQRTKHISGEIQLYMRSE